MTSAESRVGLLLRALVILVGTLLTVVALPTFAARADTSYVSDGATQLSRPVAAARTSAGVASLMMRSAVHEQSPLSAATGVAAEAGGGAARPIALGLQRGSPLLGDSARQIS